MRFSPKKVQKSAKEYEKKFVIRFLRNHVKYAKIQVKEFQFEWMNSQEKMLKRWLY